MSFQKIPAASGHRRSGKGRGGRQGEQRKRNFWLSLVPLPHQWGLWGPFLQPLSPPQAGCVRDRLTGLQGSAHSPPGCRTCPDQGGGGGGAGSPAPWAGGAQEQSGLTHASGGSSEAPGARWAQLLPTHLLAESQSGRNASTSGLRPQKDLGSDITYPRGLRVNPGEEFTIVPGI